MALTVYRALIYNDPPYIVYFAASMNIGYFFLYFNYPIEKIRGPNCFGDAFFDTFPAFLFQTWAFFTWKPKNPSEIYILPAFAVLTIFSLVFPRMVNCREHAPLKNDNLTLENETEESKQEGMWLKVKESGAFKIVVENVGTEACKYFEIIRETKDNRWFLGQRSKVILKINCDVLPGDDIVIIPQSHNEESAFKATGFRSFGFNKNLQVKTTVNIYNSFFHCPWTKAKYSTCLVQNFANPELTNKESSTICEFPF